MFFPNFSPVFSKVNFFAFLYLLTYQGDFNFYFFHFLQIWDVFNLYKLVLGTFFMVFGLGHLLNHSNLDPFRVQMKTQWMVFK